jgi:hypothetical protein
MVEHGRVGPAVTQIALIQDGHEDRRPLESHLGAWVICTEQASPFQVNIHVPTAGLAGIRIAALGHQA